MLKIFAALAITLAVSAAAIAQDEIKPFGEKFNGLDSRARDAWWEIKPDDRFQLDLNVPRNEVVAFAIYTHDVNAYAANGDGQCTLKMTAQLFPLLPDESPEARLELEQADGSWLEVAREQVIYPGWSAHFRIDDWDNTKDVRYRIRHGEEAMFEGLIRLDPIEKDEIVIGNLSCNSSRTPGPRVTMVENLKRIDPDFLYFAGDQSYHHRQHTYAWLEFGMQFREILKDRPVVTIPDDHDVGQSNIWGENGIQATSEQGPSGGYFFPAAYVNMVQRCQTWHLPDAYDPAPIERDISVYYTRMRLGGIDFAIVEDRKFKSGPEGKIPKMGPRPDHINDPSYDRASVDLPGLELLGQRQLDFLNAWSSDWRGAEMKCVLSQTAFCGAVHLHGEPDNRLLADLDSNAWPQAGRNAALRAIRRARATHLCGDQHLAVVVKHGIDAPSDGPYGFTSPAIVNTIYGRWWHPEDEQPGANPIEGSPLPWTGEYLDGLGNRIRMLAYANPTDRSDERQRGDGFGVVRFNKTAQTVTFECWPRFTAVGAGDEAQYPGWPITINNRDNDGRAPVAWLPTVRVSDCEKPVVQVISESDGEVLYTFRSTTAEIRLPVYSDGTFTLKVGADRPDGKTVEGITPVAEDSNEVLEIEL